MGSESGGSGGGSGPPAGFNSGPLSGTGAGPVGAAAAAAASRSASQSRSRAAQRQESRLRDLDQSGPQTDTGQVTAAPAPVVNPVIINQAPAPVDNTTQGLGTEGRNQQASLLTLGLADTAKKTLLGL